MFNKYYHSIGDAENAARRAYLTPVALFVDKEHLTTAFCDAPLNVGDTVEIDRVGYRVVAKKQVPTYTKTLNNGDIRVIQRDSAECRCVVEPIEDYNPYLF